jgi:Eco47II restriction endonuclease
METKNLLPFISNEDLYQHVEVVLSKAKLAKKKSEKNIFSNVLDPFSALFDISYQGITFEKWLKQEKSRQVQKTLQNAIGNFHQSIIGSSYGWENLNIGVVADVVHKEKKIVAEIKNKHNTTKGNHKTKVYEDLKLLINTMYTGYVGYYVEIIPKNKKPYNVPFMPSNNRKHEKMASNKNIRVIDGRSFYALATGYPNALRDLYEMLPQVIADIQKNTSYRKAEKEAFHELFERAYES